MEQRDEIKNSVKQGVIDHLVKEIAQEQSFLDLKAELVKELLFLEEKNIGRQLNSEDGYDPINEQEARFKKEFGFLYNAKPVEERLKKLKEQHAEIMKNSNSSFSYPSADAEFNSRFRSQFSLMKELIKDKPKTNEAMKLVDDLKDRLQSADNAENNYNEMIDTLGFREETPTHGISVETLLNLQQEIPTENPTNKTTTETPELTNSLPETEKTNKTSKGSRVKKVNVFKVPKKGRTKKATAASKKKK